MVCLWFRRMCSLSELQLPLAGFPLCGQTYRFLVSFLRFDRWVREETLSRCLWIAPAARSNTWRTSSISLSRCTGSVPKTSSPACWAAPSWRRGKWRRSRNCSSTGHPKLSRRREVSKGLVASSSSAAMVFQWRQWACLCRWGRLCSTRAYRDRTHKLGKQGQWDALVFFTRAGNDGWLTLTYENFAQS